LLPSKESLASHAMGVDFFYECLGGNNYQFTLIFYRDCDGVSAPSSASINISSSSCGQNTSINLAQQGPPVELTTLCMGNNNSTCNGGSDPGVEQYTYSGTYTLPANCPDWTFSFTHCCRNANITNLTAPDNEDMYIQATLDNSLGQCNDSPIFTELPVPFICDGGPYCYDHGATDADGDSLVYSLVNPLTGGGSNIGYVGGFSPTYPLTTFSGSVSFDNATGQMCFTPIGEQQAVITVLIEEYRNGVLIGTTMRDLQVIVLDCTNDPPPVQVSVPCGATYISLDILDPILCSSIATDGSDFTLSGPGGPYTITSVVGVGCGTSTSQIQIYITPAVTMGLTYTLTITTGSDGNTLLNDCGGEMADPTTLVFVAQPLPATIYGDSPICEGESVNLSASSGTSWLWNTGSTNQTINVTPTSTTSYSVTVFNDSCSSNASFTVNVDPAPVASFTANPNPVCVGDPITFTDNSTRCCSGLSCIIPEIYTWDFGDGAFALSLGPSNQTHTYNTVGTYTVKLTMLDPACGCDNTMSLVVNVINCNAPCSLTVSSTVVNTSCNNGADGSATANPSGGTSPYSYLWDANAGNQTSQTATGLSAGNYFVTVTDVSSCADTIMVTVNQPDVLAATTTSTPASCNGQCDGTATAIPTGGTAPYTYLWDDPCTSTTPALACGACAGTYTVYIIDAKGCTVNAPVVISQSPSLIIDISAMIIADASCSSSDGSIVGITVSGGTSPYTYLWQDSLSSGVGTTVDLNNIPSGVYTLTVTSADSCSATSGPHAVNAAGNANVTLTKTDAGCGGGCTGTATATASGGTPPYYYAWNTSPVQTSATATGLCLGNYTVTVTDDVCAASGNELITNGDFESGNTAFTSSYNYCNTSGCLGPEGTYAVGTDPFFYNPGFSGFDHTSGSGNLMVVNGATTANTNVWCQTITVTPNTVYEFSTWLCSIHPLNPAILQFSINGVNLGTTFNGPGTTGTWLQFFETWNSGPNTTATICIVNQNTASSGNDFGLDDISFQECVSTCPAINTIGILAPSGITLTVTGNDALCFNACDGSAIAVGTGGTLPYTYLWSNAAATSSVTALCMGNISITITDNLGCDTSEILFINQPQILSAIATAQPAKCGSADGTATINASGGTGAYTYMWDDTLMQSTQIADSLYSGIYNATVIDANNCSTTVPINVLSVNGPNVDSVSSTDLLCFGDANGTANVYANGGSPPLTYAWNPSSSTTDNATNLTAGTWTVTISDLYSCDTVVTITITEPGELMVDIGGSDTVCQLAVGQLTANVAGGSPGFAYTWDNGLPSDSSVTINPGNPGATTSYAVTVTDNNGCTVRDSIDVYVPLPLSLSATDTIICEGDAVTLIPIPSGGNPSNYTFLWDDNSTTTSIVVAPNTADTFFVTLSDACSNPFMLPIIVDVIPTPIAAFEAVCDPDSFLNQFTDLSTGMITSWLWDFGDLTSSTTQNPYHDYALAGSYSVTLTVSTTEGCTDTYTGSVAGAPDADFSVFPFETTTASPVIDFTDASSGDVFSWAWYFGDGESTTIATPDFVSGNIMTHTYDSAGTYTVLLLTTNLDGCVDTAIRYVHILEEYMVFAPNGFTPNSDGINDMFMPIGIGIDPDNFKLMIYNRWGDKIYETKDMNQPWDGKANNGKRVAQNEVYIWVLSTVDPKQAKHEYIGHVTLFR